MARYLVAGLACTLKNLPLDVISTFQVAFEVFSPKVALLAF